MEHEESIPIPNDLFQETEVEGILNLQSQHNEDTNQTQKLKKIRAPYSTGTKIFNKKKYSK